MKPLQVESRRIHEATQAPLVRTSPPPRLLRRRYSPGIMCWCWFPDPGVTRYSLDFVSLVGICPPGSGAGVGTR